ncbi:transglycosylase SLT domain-containing protein [Fictibacillus gelatini]|uniref:aggregation-promoting factor C-terminal-like domain-containing protein n=1 Tax=Fictibacillus gelatini TaxID=225985 RepID=UPI00041AAE3A|nr:transglycosylase SLT domain-containing protein [Fictibacillus gelatini]
MFKYKYKPLTYNSATTQAARQLDPLYQNSFNNLQRQQRQNEMTASTVVQARGLANSGLAADQQTKLSLATQGQITDLNAQKASQIGQMALNSIQRNQDINDRRRSQLFNEYMGQQQFDFQKARDKIADSHWDLQYNASRSDAKWEKNWRKYQYNHMSASQKAQLDWAKKRYGEDAAWRMYELNSNLTAQKEMYQAQMNGLSGANYTTSSGPKSFQKNMAAAVKMGVDPAWVPLLSEIVRRESSYNPTAKNPKSTAYGYAQFLSSTRRAYEKKTGLNYNNPVHQLVMMAQYVKDRYGTPAKALAFWNAHKWYALPILVVGSLLAKVSFGLF